MKKVRIKDLGEVITGNTPPKSNSSFYGSYKPFIKATDIRENSKYTYLTEECYSELAFQKYQKSLIPQGSTCVVTIGTVGKKMTMAKTDCFVNQAINAIVPNEHYDNEYVYYLLKYNLSQLKTFDSGTTSGRENISKTAFENICVNVIEDKSSQKRIGNILSTYDSLIENNTKRIRLLEQMTENLYKEWFVRFRFPGHEKVEMENGLPKGWRIIQVKDLAKVKSGFAFKSEWFQDSGVPAIKIKDIQNRTIDLSDFSYVSKEIADKAKNFDVKGGDLLIALTGATIGKIAIVPIGDRKTVNQRVGKFFLGNNPIEKMPFLYCLFIQNHIQEQILSIAGSNAAQPNISPFDVEKIKVLCDKSIVDEFNKKVNPLFKELLNLQTQTQSLTRQRDLLLPRLMSGKLEVKV